MISKYHKFSILLAGVIVVYGAVFDSAQAGLTDAKLELKDKIGKTIALPIWTKNKASVLIFAGTECPISNRYIPLLNKMYDKYVKKNVQFYAVYSAPNLDSKQISKHASEFRVKAQIIWDYKQELARATGAKITPQAIVVGNDGEIKYSGRIDNQYVSLGKARNEATTHELDEALGSLVKGDPVKTSRTDVVGCCIPEL